MGIRRASGGNPEGIRWESGGHPVGIRWASGGHPVGIRSSSVAVPFHLRCISVTRALHIRCTSLVLSGRFRQDIDAATEPAASTDSAGLAVIQMKWESSENFLRSAVNGSPRMRFRILVAAFCVVRQTLLHLAGPALGKQSINYPLNDGAGQSNIVLAGRKVVLAKCR